jgi:steroid delta-isomerase-like uncharacterized protein
VTTSHGAIVREIFERAWNSGDFDGLDRLLADPVDFHYRRSMRTMRPDDLRRTVQSWRSAFPDLRFSVEELIEEADLVAARVTHTGTQRGHMRGHPATGRRMEIDAMYFFRFAYGRLVEVWEVDDEYAMWEQLGPSLDPGAPR